MIFAEFLFVVSLFSDFDLFKELLWNYLFIVGLLGIIYGLKYLL